MQNVFHELDKRIDFKLCVIGNFQYDLPGIDLEVIQWTKEKEVEDLQGIDIGIYPLAQDDWVLGKSGLKALSTNLIVNISSSDGLASLLRNPPGNLPVDANFSL